MWAAYGGRTKVVQVLLDAGADMDKVGGVGSRSALIWATITGQKAVVALLCAAGADRNARDDNGKTALLWARDREEDEIASILDRE